MLRRLEAEVALRERQGHRDARAAVDELRYGVRPLSTRLEDELPGSLLLVPAEVVAAAIRWLTGVGPDDFDEWPDEDFVPWQRMYLEASERGEAVLIGC
jgi:hypothetical protein